MTELAPTRWRPEPWWLLFGVVGGAVVGALTGLLYAVTTTVTAATDAIPPLGVVALVIYGMFFGALVGLAPGFVIGVALIFTAGRGLSLTTTRLLAALTTLVLAPALLYLVWGRAVDPDHFRGALFLFAFPAVLGAGLAAWVAGPMRDRPRRA